MATKTENSISVGVTRIFKLKGDKTVKAFANVDIFVNGIFITSIDGVKVLDNGGEGGAWVGMPSSSYKDKNGKLQYNDIVSLGQTTDYAVKDAVLAAFDDDSLIVKSQRPVRKAKGATAVVNSSSPSNEEDIPF
jgi:DNA-binding cell septation regulator SpoVG